MAKSVFYSFHYDRDNWRVQQVMNMNLLEGQPLLNSQDWESVKRGGKVAIEKWIADQMAYTKAVVVLVGAETSTREWVDYEIRKAWGEKRPLVGIRIHGLLDAGGQSDYVGADPFAGVLLQNGRTIADYVTLHSPAGQTSKDVYADIKANIATWVDNAYARS
jgi:hypothetical protein